MVQLYSQRFSSPQPVYEMAAKIDERLTGTIENELVFPSLELNEGAFGTYFISIYPRIDKDNAGFKVEVDGKKPFVKHVIFGLYDKTNHKFLSKTEYYYLSFIGPIQLNPTRKFSATKLQDYQLWVWAENELVFIGDYEWEQ